MIATMTFVTIYGLILVCGLFLFVSTFTTSWRPVYPMLLTALWSAGLLSMGWAALSLAVHYRWDSLSPLSRARFMVFRRVCSGADLALLFLLFTSRDFWEISLRRPWF